jgi:hypothetical protein
VVTVALLIVDFFNGHQLYKFTNLFTNFLVQRDFLDTDPSF